MVSVRFVCYNICYTYVERRVCALKTILVDDMLLDL